MSTAAAALKCLVTAKIEGCQAISTSAYGGGVYVNSSRSFVMSAKAEIESCQAISKSSDSSNGGGVYLANNTEFTLSGSAVIQNCTATNSATPGEAYGGGVSADCVRKITLEGNAQIVQMYCGKRKRTIHHRLSAIWLWDSLRQRRLG